MTTVLTDVDLEIVRGLAGGRRKLEIAHELAISSATLRQRLAVIKTQLGVPTEIEAVVHLVRRGVL